MRQLGFTTEPTLENVHPTPHERGGWIPRETPARLRRAHNRDRAAVCRWRTTGRTSA